MLFSLRQNAERIGPVQQFNNQFRLGAVLALESNWIVMKRPVMLAAKWDRKNIVCLGTNAALPPSDKVMRIVGRLTAAHTWLSLYPGNKTIRHPADPLRSDE